MKKTLFVLSWLLSLTIAILYTYENPETFDMLKYKIKEYRSKTHTIKNPIIPETELEKGPVQKVIANSFNVEFSKIISMSESFANTIRTAFIVHDEDILNFDENSLKIYTQNGFLLKNFKSERLNLPKTFLSVEKNGGVKTIFIYNDHEFALISSKKHECFYASIVLLSKGKEIFKTKCLPTDNLDFNGLGSSNIHHKNQIFLIISIPTRDSYEVHDLAQDKNSVFGKIVEINKNDLDKIIANEENNLDVKIFTMGHRTAQGLTKINESFFSVEHGPKGGDELNKIIKGKNYGWPKVSYGTKYMWNEKGKSFEISHENNECEGPLFALVPSVGISAVNSCPKKLKTYYKKPCLLALSLYGNQLRSGRSLIIYLLNEKMDKVHSVEKIHLRADLRLRHFVTNSKNELYEDKEGNIYVSADKKGIYKLSFINFRN